MSLVIDSSMTLGWVYADERTSASTEILHRVHREGAWVPTIWRFEIANALQFGVKKKRITKSERTDLLADLHAMNISIDPHSNLHAWGETLDLTDRFRLTTYDASYVELALRRHLPLATLDRDIQTACEALGIPLL